MNKSDTYWSICTLDLIPLFIFIWPSWTLESSQNACFLNFFLLIYHRTRKSSLCSCHLRMYIIIVWIHTTIYSAMLSAWVDWFIHYKWSERSQNHKNFDWLIVLCFTPYWKYRFELVFTSKFHHSQARIQEFQNGGARSRRGRILRSKICFDASLHIPYVFVRRVVNNIHIVNTACWLKSKYLRIYNENLPKKSTFFFKRGGGRRAGLGSAFDSCLARQEFKLC